MLNTLYFSVDFEVAKELQIKAQRLVLDRKSRIVELTRTISTIDQVARLRTIIRLYIFDKIFFFEVRVIEVVNSSLNNILD